MYLLCVWIVDLECESKDLGVNQACILVLQEKFYNLRTVNLSKADVVKKVSHFATAVVGNPLESGFNDSKTDIKTRVSFKFSASRGIYGTPSFLVNGFAVPDNGSPLDFNGWKKIIDPLIVKNKDDQFDLMRIFI
ncbi:hypothetical protein LINPERPRIM_LOCUS29607 [Linum perenne]